MRDTGDGRDPGWDVPAQPWVLAAHEHWVWRRSLLLEITVRAVFPTVLLVSLYLLFVGHHSTGGGFAGGLVAGLAFVLRYVVGGSAELAAAVRLRPLGVMGAGLAVATVLGIAPLAFGRPPLSSAEVTLTLPVLGELKVVSSLGLDIGVYLLVTGGVLDLLRTIGAGVQADEESPGYADEVES